MPITQYMSLLLKYKSSEKPILKLKPWSLGIGHWSLDIIEIYLTDCVVFFLIPNTQYPILTTNNYQLKTKLSSPQPSISGACSSAQRAEKPDAGVVCQYPRKDARNDSKEERKTNFS